MVIFMNKINAILFDLDGTLIDSNKLIIDAFRETFKKYIPNREFSQEEFADLVGPPLIETFKMISEDPEVIQEAIKYYRKYYLTNETNNIKLYPNVIQALEYFKKNDIQLAVVTTKNSISALTSIKYFGLDKYIKYYSFFNNVKNHKPHPEPVFFALRQMNKVDKALMVGDNASDILAGENANILTCSVNWSINKKALDRLNPTFRINDYLDLIEIIKKYNKED